MRHRSLERRLVKLETRPWTVEELAASAEHYGRTGELPSNEKAAALLRDLEEVREAMGASIEGPDGGGDPGGFCEDGWA